MSALLKSGSSAARAKVRPLATQITAPDPVPARPDPELDRLRHALAEAERRLAEQERLIADIPAAIEGALAEGVEKGRVQAEDREAERLEILDKAAERALGLYAENMVELERLAAMLAQTCLDRMLLDDETRTETVTALLRAQLAGLEAGAAVRIEVSGDDFAAPEALEVLSPPPCEIIISPSMKGGDCAVRLRLGTIEVGIGQQWGALRAVLEEQAG